MVGGGRVNEPIVGCGTGSAGAVRYRILGLEWPSTMTPFGGMTLLITKLAESFVTTFVALAWWLVMATMLVGVRSLVVARLEVLGPILGTRSIVCEASRRLEIIGAMGGIGGDHLRGGLGSLFLEEGFIINKLRE